MVSRKLLWHHESSGKQELISVATEHPLCSSKQLVLLLPCELLTARSRRTCSVLAAAACSPHPVTKCLQEASGQQHICMTVTVHMLSQAAVLGTAVVVALRGLLCDREGALRCRRVRPVHLVTYLLATSFSRNCLWPKPCSFELTVLHYQGFSVC